MKLPEIIAGPILRRVEKDKVYIWMCMSKRFTLDAKLFSVATQEKDNRYNELAVQTTVQTIQFGENIYISLLEIQASSGIFPLEQLLAYNILFQRGSKSHDLNHYYLLTRNHPDSIVYGDLKYPTFYITAQNKHNFLYGSCRKVHGAGDDALSNGDDLLQKTYRSLDQRPTALFLMGDQIYADDIADPMSYPIRKIGKALLGEKEEQLEKIEPRLADKPFQANFDQIHGRQFIMEHFASFTSQHAHNHLVRLGEFLAMYGFAFGPHLWRLANENELFLSFNDIYQNNKLRLMYPDHDAYKNERKQEIIHAKERYEKQLEEIIHFQSTISNVGRLLANVPTYMVFDDHEVTDDWNINELWKEEVEHSKLGNHTIANALTAYWAFQAWGNDPSQFDPPFLHTLSRYVKTFQYDTVEYYKWKRMILTCDRWTYVAPTIPKALVLDTRTNREFNIDPKPAKIGHQKESIQLPQLLSEEGWIKTEAILKRSHWRKEEPLVVVTSLPLYGLDSIDSLLTNYLYPLHQKGIPIDTMFDMEKWKYNMKGFISFHEQLVRWGVSEAIILSGDSHLSRAVLAKYQRRQKTEGICIREFTCSPLKNESFSGLYRTMIKSFTFLYDHVKQFKEMHVPKDQDLTEFEKVCLKREHIGIKTLHTKNRLGLLVVKGEQLNNYLLSTKRESINKTPFSPSIFYDITIR